MDGRNLSHWGEWVRARARSVGFRRQLDLAVAVGCVEDQLCRWLSNEAPPMKMRKGFDAKLAEALRVDRETLFNLYAATDPYELRIENESERRQRIVSAAMRLHGTRLRALSVIAEELASSAA